MSDTATKRTVAHDARLFARTIGLEGGHGSRGRVSANVVLQYLTGQPAKTVRQIASDLGVSISPTGKVSEAELIAVTDFVVKNTPKAS